MVTIKEKVASVPGLSLVVAIPETLVYGSTSLLTIVKIPFAKLEEAYYRKGNGIKSFEAESKLTGYKKDLSERLWALAKAILAIIPGVRYYLAKKEEKLANLLAEAESAPDLNVKIEKYKQAAALGSSKAIFELAVITPDQSLYYQYLEQAANQGNSRAQFRLSKEYMRISDDPLLYPHVVKWLKLAALQNNPKALNALGVYYKSGKYGLKELPELGSFLVKKAYDLDNNNQQIKANHASHLIEAVGVKQDKNKGFLLMYEAAEKNNVWAQYKLGEYYEKGEYCVKNLDTAKKFYKQAADNGDLNSHAALVRLFPPAPPAPAPEPIPEKAGAFSWFYSLRG